MPEYLVYPVAGSLLAIFPTALLMGIAFPIGLHLWASQGRQTAERVGLFYSLNVAGAIVGSLAGGFLLLPAPRKRRVAGAARRGQLRLRLRPARRRPRFAGRPAGGRRGRFRSIRLGRLDVARSVRAVHGAALRRHRTSSWKEEGVEATVVVHQLGSGPNSRLLMTINGNHQAGTDFPTTFTHRRIGHLPMVVHPGARTALVIGLGGGATAGAVSIHDGRRRRRGRARRRRRQRRAAFRRRSTTTSTIARTCISASTTGATT